MVYIGMFALLFLFSRSKRKRNDRLFKLGLLLVIVLTCLRSPKIGIDTSGGYYDYYQWILAGTHLGWVEPGWEIINRISIFLGLEYQGAIAIAGLLTLLPVGYVISRKCENKCLALALYYGMYFPLYSYNIMRQMIAVSFALLSMLFFIEKKYIKSILFLVLGFFFHKSILFILAVPVFMKIRLSYRKTVVITIISFAMGILLSGQVLSAISGKYAANLLNTDGYSGYRSSFLMPALMSLAFSAFFLFVTYFHSKNLRENPWYIISSIGIFVMNLTIRMGQGTRMVFYFSQVHILFFTEYLNQISNRINRRVVKTIYYAYILINFLRVLLDQWPTLNPYCFFWQ